jgi:glutamate dehydrogenase
LNPRAEDSADLIEEVLALVRARVPAREQAQVLEFTRQFYRQVDPEDLRERETADLYGAALSQWHFVRRCAGGRPKVRIYNPRIEEHGWQSPHTVIELANSDRPFLVDSVRMEVNRQGYTIHLIIHPVMRVRRDGEGNLLEILPPGPAETTRGPEVHFESFMHVEMSRETDPEDLAKLEQGLLRVLEDVRAAVDDWKPMVQRMRRTVEAIRESPPPLAREEIVEGIAFLEWLMNDHFTFLGCRDYDLATEGGEDVLKVVPGSGLGILREKGGEAQSVSFATLPPEVREQARVPELLILTKSNSRATVHRPAYMDYVGIKRFDAGGRVVGERRFLGLYTSTAYSAAVLEIPVLRQKVRAVIERAELLPGSHMGKNLLTILETYPRDELFQICAEELYRIAMGILRLQERQRTRLFVRRDRFGRFLSCLIFVPRDSYNTEVRQRMQQVLMEAFNGVSSEFSVSLTESVLARVLIVVHTRPGTVPQYDARELEARLTRVARRWEDDLAEALIARLGEERGTRLARTYQGAFPAGYREDCSPRAAVHDIEIMEGLGEEGLGMSLYLPLEASEGELRFKLFRRAAPVLLSQSLPMLEHMGVQVLDERPYEIKPEGAAPVWIHDMGLATGKGAEVDIDAVRELFQEAFLHVWRGEAESDDFNRLVLGARLHWREIAVLRAYAKYSRQCGAAFSQAYMEHTLAAHPAIAAKLIALFHERHDPRRPAGAQERAQALTREIEEALEEVASLDEDRILRRFLALVLATLRTNFYQRTSDDRTKPYLSFKLDPSKVPGMPEPRPMFEIYVYSPRVEGVHLRGGKVARGGIRWSDRMEDFRTEILGLMKAQMVKNAVIVPVGAKGGFVVKQPPAGDDRDALLKEGMACYSVFIRGLLDLTDNRVGSRVVPPQDVVCHDDDDPYLVVAADKGTATFSDIANGIAREYGFWLGDAFASGGSAGYDHKKMGITARGVWESVKKHFRTLGVDIQATDFTVAGIGDMSGDVFGNGMLLSRHIKLIAAFDHRHVFIDPDPDPETSYRERERLFRLPRSSWADYDPKLLSQGGGVYSRSAKSIALSPQARRALGIDTAALTPAELIRAILKAPVDLLYNGGIGTYVKASAESHADVGDRTNDAVRVDARELRCRVVGEGGNLGFTQRGRIEYALRGGLINTDAIDNSAGVDCSDHEVNIKILLDAVVAEGELTQKQRNRLLAEMTDEVTRLVLQDNYDQAQSLAVSGAQGVALLDPQARLMRYLERQGKLNRALEFLPSEEEIAARRSTRIGLTAPERAVLLAYGKIWLFDELMRSSVPEDPFIGRALADYFPTPLRGRYGTYMERHPLKREIIATQVCNALVNRMGSAFVYRMMEETGAAPADVVRAYVAAREVFHMPELWREIEALDNRVADRLQTAMLVRSSRVLVRATLWFLRHRLHAADLEQTIARLRAPVEALAGEMGELLQEEDRERLEEETREYVEGGVPAALALRVARLEPLYAALDIAEVSRATARPASSVAQVYFRLAARLRFSWLREQVGLLPTDSHWQALARTTLRDELGEKLRALVAVILKARPELAEADALIQAWASDHQGALARLQQMLTELQAASQPDLAMLLVALRELRNLA